VKRSSNEKAQQKKVMKVNNEGEEPNSTIRKILGTRTTTSSKMVIRESSNIITKESNNKNLHHSPKRQ
jgi:hypothetical protein